LESRSLVKFSCGRRTSSRRSAGSAFVAGAAGPQRQSTFWAVSVEQSTFLESLLIDWQTRSVHMIHSPILRAIPRQPSRRTSTEDGMQIDSNNFQSSTADPPIIRGQWTRKANPIRIQQLSVSLSKYNTNGRSASIKNGGTIGSGDPIAQFSHQM
jgi:hypothetical protein